MPLFWGGGLDLPTLSGWGPEPEKPPETSKDPTVAPTCISSRQVVWRGSLPFPSPRGTARHGTVHLNTCDLRGIPPSAHMSPPKSVVGTVCQRRLMDCRRKVITRTSFPLFVDPLTLFSTTSPLYHSTDSRYIMPPLPTLG